MLATTITSQSMQEATLSVAEYLELEISTGERHDYYNGKVVKMAGGTLKHNLIVNNILFALNTLLDNEDDIFIFGSDQKIHLPKLNFYVYPDAVVVAENPIISDNDTQAIVNPLLVIVVLSPSTEAYDRGEKFLFYKTLASFKEYVLIRQDEVEVSTFFREEANLWRSDEVAGLENVVVLRSLNISIPLARIYKKIFS